MASTTWLHWRVWCGRLPHFHLLAEPELLVEREFSLLHFDSLEFASLRTQIRLKLKETPLINQTRRSVATYTSVLELLNQYLPYVLALNQYSELHDNDKNNGKESHVVFSPLFYGFNSIDLRSDRVLCRHHQRIQHALAVDLVLTLFTMAQMHALYAEAQVDQGVRLQNDSLLKIAERCWQDAQTLFERASAFATDAVTKMSSQLQLLGPVWTFLGEIAATAHTMGHMCAMHRISTRVYFLILLEETTERLARAVSAYARYAHTIAVNALAQLDVLSDSEFTRQVEWLIKTYAIRWKAVYFNCEQSVYQLDFRPDIAIHFADAILRLRLSPLPSYSHRHDSFFTRIAQELQLVHQGHQNDALDEKKGLLHACQQRSGGSYQVSEEGENRGHEKDLLRVRELFLKLNGADSASSQEERRPSSLNIVAASYEEHESALIELLKRIDVNVRRAVERQERGNDSMVSDVSQLGTVDTGSMDRKRRHTMLGELPPEVCDVMTTMVDKSLLQSPRYSNTERNNSSREIAQSTLTQDDLASVDGDSGRAVVKAFIQKSSSPSAFLEALETKKRPSSAQLPATKDVLHRRTASTTTSQQDTGWVKMTVGGKTLNFENVSLVATSSTVHDSPARRRNAVPMALPEDDFTDLRARTSSGRLKPRPSSSPSYLSVRNANKVQDHEAEDDTSGSTSHLHEHQSQMWAPTRGQCALCERRYMRNHLAGVVVMKRIFDLRRKWGMVIHNSKKFYAASAMYAKAQVCLMCQEILLHEDEKCIQASENDHHQLRPQSAPNTSSSSSVKSGSAAPETDEVGHMIYNTIVAQWHQLPAQIDECLEDVALNKRARQSSTIFGMDARNAVQPDAIRCTHTKEEFQPWWEVDLANYYVIHSVKIWLREEISHLYNRSGSTSGSGGGSATATSNERPTLRKTTFRSTQQPPLRHLGMYPLHISISMKTGVGRDLDDIIASCVSSHCLEERVMPPIVWHAPPNSRGRFVRIQAEKQAILHIERVHVYIASLTLQQQKVHETRVRKATLRQQMKKAAFRASVVANPAPKGSVDLVAIQGGRHLAPKGGHHERKQPGSHSGNQSTLIPTAGQVHPHALVSTFLEPEHAEQKRLSRLYSRFKSLLDARSKYIMGELDQERQAQSTDAVPVE